ncbi:dystroglycan 1 [Lampetra fluviatilis]
MCHHTRLPVTNFNSPKLPRQCVRSPPAVQIVLLLLPLVLAMLGASPGFPNADAAAATGDDEHVRLVGQEGVPHIEASLHFGYPASESGRPAYEGKRPWQASDVVATVGHAFQLPIPLDGGPGRCTNVTEEGKKSLPDWLSWNAELNTLFGLPLEANTGLYFIAISHPSPNGDVHRKEMFPLHVVSEQSNSRVTDKLPSFPGSADGGCGPEEAVTVLTIIIDADLTKMNPGQRLQLLKKMEAFSDVKVDKIKLMPVINNRLFDMSAFMAGPGNAKKVIENGALLSWKLGCSLNQSTIPNIASVELPAKEGTMAEKIGYPVLGWHIANQKAVVNKRSRRQLYLTPTPVLVFVPATARVEPVEPPVRIVPSHVSPTFGPTDVTEDPVRYTAPGHIVTQVVTVTPSKVRPSVYATPILFPIQPTAIDTITVTVGQSIQPTAARPEYVEPTVTVASTADGAKATPTGATGGGGRIKTTTAKPTAAVTKKPRTKKPVLKLTTPAPTPPMKATTTTAPVAKITTKATTTTSRTTTKIIPDPNRPPTLKNPIDRLDVNIGTYFELKIPYDTFFDHEDGTTDRLKLVLCTSKHELVNASSWVQFNSTSQVLFGLPPDDEKLIGKHEYIMSAMDKGGKIARDAFEIIVHKKPNDGRSSAKFQAKFNNDYKKVANDVLMKIKLVKKLAYTLGDKNVSALTIDDMRSGSFTIVWNNNSLPLEPCPDEQIRQLGKKIGTDDGKPTESFDANMGPEFKPVSVNVVGSEDCEGISFVPVRKGPPMDRPQPTTPPPLEGPERTSQDDVYLHTVIPAVVVAAILLIAGVIAMICYRKKRKGKLSEEDQATFIKKGVPIIFADELDDTKPAPSSSMPLILTEEKPPLPPPEYPCQMAGPGMSAAVSAATDDFVCESTPLREEDPNAPPYQPPPPFTSPQGAGGRGQRPKNMTPYRSPPPYVPP